MGRVLYLWLRCLSRVCCLAAYSLPRRAREFGWRHAFVAEDVAVDLGKNFVVDEFCLVLHAFF